MAALLGVSWMTLSRRLHKYDLTGQQAWNNLSDEDLDERVSSCITQHSERRERILMGALKGKKVRDRIQRWRLRKSIGGVNPVGRQLRWSQAIRRRPSVPCSNALWHIDIYVELVWWGFTNGV